MAQFSVSFLVMLAVLPARANDLPQTWSACKTSTDREVINATCGATVAVNVHYKSEARAEICKTEDCSNIGDAAIQAPRAICRSGHRTPDYSFPHR